MESMMYVGLKSPGVSGARGVDGALWLISLKKRPGSGGGDVSWIASPIADKITDKIVDHHDTLREFADASFCLIAA
jgi:hypothetical protein